MINATFTGWTTWVGDPEIAHTKNGDVNRVLFRVAVNRYTGKVNPDGTKVQETDFVLCSALGQPADFIIRNCSARKPDGKVYSRQLFVVGTFISYQKEKLYKVTVPFNGQQTNMDVTVPDCEQWQMQVSYVEALNKRPETTEGVTATFSGQPQPQQQPQTVPGAGVAPQAPQGCTQYDMPYAPQQQAQNFNAMNPPAQPQAMPSQTPQAQTQPQGQVPNASAAPQAPFTNIPTGIPESPIKVPEGYSGNSTPF